MKIVNALLGASVALVLWFGPSIPADAATDVVRATLSNGLRVIVVRDTLAPVATAMMNYRVGSDEQWIPGLAHATEHMMFRGSATLSSSQLMDAVGITGGDFDADTTSTVTQYFFTVPSAYLDIALRAERSRATGLLMAQDQWEQERGPITQEVQQDNSDAFYRLFVKMQDRILGGTPYAKNTLGTVADFAHSVNSDQLLKFYRAWYHPNNAIYIIAGDVDPQATIAKVRQIFGDIPAATLPPREPVRLNPLRSELFRETSDQSFTAVALGYRFPGYDSPDFAAGQILSDVLSSQRSTFRRAVHRQGARHGVRHPGLSKSGHGDRGRGPFPVGTPPRRSTANCGRSSRTIARAASRRIWSPRPSCARFRSWSLAPTRSKGSHRSGVRR